MSSSLYLLPNSTLPNGPGYYLAILQNPLYLVVKFTLPNHRVNTAQLASPCCQVSIHFDKDGENFGFFFVFLIQIL